MINAPSYAPFEDAELAGLDQSGVRIAAIKYQRADGTTSIRLKGICQCSDEEISDIPEIVLKAVYAVVIFGELHLPSTFQVIGESILFDDDNYKYAGFTRGYFDIDLFNQAKLDPRNGTFFISVAFATYLSNVVPITL
ncbi:MAG: hypothetical protein HY273_11495 [Gammaproteobacteria bacterium]|nr:hypothetical protein [Gammaproteobacteria bacterium]